MRGKEPGQKGPIKTVTGRNIITCAGLHADRVATKGGGKARPTVVRRGAAGFAAPCVRPLSSFHPVGVWDRSRFEAPTGK